jgi:hypothetical protein
MHNLLRTHTQFVAAVGGLLFWLLFNLSTANYVIATTFLSPLQVPEPFLSVPFYGPEWVTANVDHDPLGGGANNRILIFDGRTANATNGWCDGANYNPHIAFWTAPNPPRTCLWYDAHHGHDFSLYYEPVFAAADGTVIRAGWQDWNNRYAGYGLHLFISHANGYETRYGHLSALAVMTNATVYRGNIIGTSGNTGNAFGAPASGHHLHFEVRLNGQVTDPFGGAGANWLWRDGSWDAQGRWSGQPTPRYGATFVVDDDYPEGGTPDDPNFSKGHTIQGPYGSQWEYCPPGQCDYWYRVLIGNDGDMLYTSVNGSVTDYWAMWKPPRAGMYDVQVWIPSDHATSWWARYWWLSALNGMPAMYTVVDQWGITNQWISLGIHSFSSSLGSSGWYGVWISDATNESGNAHGNQANLCDDVVNGQYYCRIGVDAVRFRVPWPTYIPIVLKNY